MVAQRERGQHQPQSQPQPQQQSPAAPPLLPPRVEAQAKRLAADVLQGLVLVPQQQRGKILVLDLSRSFWA